MVLKNMIKVLGLGLLTLAVVGCSGGGSTHNEGSHYTYAFSVDTEGWTGGFSDYDKNIETSLSLRFAHTLLPDPLDTSDGAVVLSGINRSDDLFMYMKHKIDGLDANTTYALTFTVEFASNEPDGGVGIGGAPGEAVTLKAGAVAYEPKSILDASGYYQMNIDKGNQTSGGADMVAIGNFANGTDRNEYVLKTVRNDTPFRVRTDENGTMWVIVSTDSGFEGSTTIYYNQVDVELEKVQ